MTKKYYRYILILISFAIFLTFAHIINNSGLYYNYGTEVNLELKTSQSNLKIKQHLLKALRYARGNNAKEEILKALQIITNVVNIDRAEIAVERIHENGNKSGLQDVCMEKYLGKIDHPLYHKGQGEYTCKKKPFKDVLSFVILVDNCLELRSVLKGLRRNYTDSKVIFGVNDDSKCIMDQKDKDITIEIAKNNNEDSLKLLSKVTTEFVLLANNIYHFDNQSHVERLVQMVSYTDAEVASGGVRLGDGRFMNGCYQMAMKMYALKLVAGYDMSFNSCLHCDYSPAPFVARTTFLREQLLKLGNKGASIHSGLSNLQLFSNMMINNRPQILVCPDVLFHVKPHNLSLVTRQQWFPFVSFFSLNKIILHGNENDVNDNNQRVLKFSCAEASMACHKKKGLMVPPCCLQELSDSLKFMNRLLQAQNVTFEVLEGTVMGGLKFNNILFWELDADTNYRVQAIDRLEAKLDVLKKQGYTMSLTYECPYKRDHEKCRHAGWHGSIYYAFRTPNWRTEMYGVTYILSDFRGELKEPTKINIDGEWYITYTNPALYARNIYGGDPYQHVEHASVFGATDAKYSEIHNGEFSACPQPGFHGCLSNFAGEGGLQFHDVYV